ncbi:MAG TPA: hypothetical protein VLH39_00195, partial [Magnetospirillaceae bacterium]|nr:hypothetical protein [Magnetospirillaceae bacterium]
MKRAFLTRLVFVVLAMAMVSVLLGCAPAARPVAVEDRELTIGIVTLQMRAPYFIGMVRAIEAAAAEYANVNTVVV